MSVYHLVNSLCSSLIKEVGPGNSGVELVAAKRIAFETLLNKSIDESVNVEKVVEEYQFCCFELLLIDSSSRTSDVEAFIELLREKPPDLLPISALLVKLKNINPVKQNRQHDFLQLPSVTTQDLIRNKYFSQIPLNQEPVSTLETDRGGAYSRRNNNHSPNFLSSILELNVGKKDSLKLRPIEAPPLVRLPPASPQNHNFASRRAGQNSWESLSTDGDNMLEKSFCSESNNSFICQRISARRRHFDKAPIEIVTVPLEKLLNDIKLLLIGIESESFKRISDTLVFQATTKFCCESIADLSNLLERFLEAGTCFKRLKVYTGKNIFNQNQIFTGFMFKAFCDRLVMFLNYCRDIIYSQEIETLLELYNNTEKMRRIIVHVSKFLKIHPLTSSTQQPIIPSGSEFLRLLYDEFSNTVNDEVKSFYIELLRSCCDVYYLRYQEWFYHGKLEDPHEELFIYFVDHYSINTKYFFDRAYIIRTQSVPSFLVGCTDDILLCGKYTGLLKSFNPTHPLLRMKKPSFKICLSFEEINALREYCKEFVKKARLECGEAMSILEVMEGYRKKKLEKYRNAEVASFKNMQKWNQQQKERVEKIRVFREHQQKELQKELELIEEKRLLKRMEEIQAERDYMDELEEIEKIELERENVELKEKIKIYQQLNEKSEIALSDIKLTFSSSEDILNANNPNVVPSNATIVDELNNVIESKLDFRTDAQKNKMKAMSHEYGLTLSNNNNDNGNNDDDESTKALTDAQRNKLKVMGHEYNMIEEIKSQPAISVQDYDKMTDLQRNRLRVMSTEYEQIERQHLQKETTITESHENNCQMTDLQRNRKKVLSHEFAYDTVEDRRVRQDKKNSPESAKLSLDLLKPESSYKQSLESPMSVTSDHFNSELNESMMEKSAENIDADQQQQIDDVDYEIMMKAFEEAIENNKSNFIVEMDRLNDSNEKSVALINDIRKLDAMSLAHFLQASLTLPLSAYMELLNNEILKMFIKDLNVLSHFKSLRNYFLLMNGEYCSSICHEMFSKIENGARPVEILNYQALHLMLDQALSGSRFYDTNTENLSFIVQSIPEKFELYSPGVLNMLTLSYKVSWPLSLILNPETIDQYKAIFNYLIKLKRISFSLEQCFQLLKESHKQNGSELLKSHHYRNVQFTRHKMMQFISCLENYVTRNVIQTSWNALMQDLKSATTFLAIYRKHTHYLKRILFLCLLTRNSHEFYKSIEDIFKVILKFHKHLKSKSWNNSSGLFVHENYDKLHSDDHDFDRLLKYVMYLGNKIVQHGNQKEMHDLLQLIDINGYYSRNNN